MKACSWHILAVIKSVWHHGEKYQQRHQRQQRKRRDRSGMLSWRHRPYGDIPLSKQSGGMCLVIVALSEKYHASSSINIGSQ